jgi:hypothetical protein
MRRVGRSGVACVLALLALGACGERAPLPQACIEAQPADVLQALAPAADGDRVVLHDGTPLSRCVARAVDDGRLQALGATLTAAADRLAGRMDTSSDAAFQLGFLIGATARGSDSTAGFQGDLADRIANAAGLDGGPHRAALLRGRDAGRRDG